MCLLLPKLINPTNPISDASYVGVSFSNPAAWLASVLIMGFAVLYFMKKGELKVPANDELSRSI